MSVWQKILGLKKQTLLTLSLAVLLSTVVAPDAEAIRKERARRYDYSTQVEQQLDRLRYVMVPLLRVTNHRIATDDIRVSIVDDPAINAASAGDGRYYVTTGLLNQASDDQLRGVLAHGCRL